MEDDVKTRVRNVLTMHLEANDCRKTPERYAILDAIYSMNGYFTMEEIAKHLANNNFNVSRGTLYNAMKLFVELRLVLRHRFLKTTKYEACYASDNHCIQMCTVCGKFTDINIPQLNEALDSFKYKRFRKDCYSVYVYGVCSSCQHRMSHKKTTNMTKDQ